MKQHKWHKEIKAWADGKTIQKQWDYEDWKDVKEPEWDKDVSFCIKPQPKEPQYLYVYRLNNKTVIAEPNTHFECKSLDGIKFIGKIKLEVEDGN